MPQVQYLDRQADPIAMQIASYGNDLAETIQKTQALKLTSMEYQVKLKNAQTDQDKLELDRRKQLTDIMEKSLKLPPGKPRMAYINIAVKGIYGGDGKKMFGDMHLINQDTQDNLKQLIDMPQPAEERLKEAQIPEAQARTDQAQQDANLSSRMQTLLQAQGLGNTSLTGASSGSATPIIPSVNIKGINAVFPDAQNTLTRQHAMQTQLGQEEANKQIREQLLNSSDNKEYPVGATISGGGLTYSPNPKLDDTSITAVTGADKFEPLVDRVTSLIDSGVLNSGKSRVLTQGLAEGGGNPVARLLTKDNTKLEELASAANELGKYAFAEGGKNLTPAEIKTIKGGLSFIGKSDKQIKNDLREAIDILRRKKIYILGGANISKYQANSPGANRVSAMRDAEREIPSKPAKSGGKLMKDAQGNIAMVYPDGTIEEQ